MKIIIQRHGKPDIGEWGRISSTEMIEWINCYNESGIVADNKPCLESLTLAKGSFLLSSTLERSICSAQILKEKGFVSDSLFCEAELPVLKVPFLKMMPHTWAAIFRIFWMLGLSNNVESRTDNANRVKDSCEKLEQLAKEHKNIFLVGHGIMNRFIAKELLKSGWSKEKAENEKRYCGSRYWEYSTFTKQ